MRWLIALSVVLALLSCKSKEQTQCENAYDAWDLDKDNLYQASLKGQDPAKIYSEMSKAREARRSLKPEFMKLCKAAFPKTRDCLEQILSIGDTPECKEQIAAFEQKFLPAGLSPEPPSLAPILSQIKIPTPTTATSTSAPASTPTSAATTPASAPQSQDMKK